MEWVVLGKQSMMFLLQHLCQQEGTYNGFDSFRWTNQ